LPPQACAEYLASRNLRLHKFDIVAVGADGAHDLLEIRGVAVGYFADTHSREARHGPGDRVGCLCRQGGYAKLNCQLASRQDE